MGVPREPELPDEVAGDQSGATDEVAGDQSGATEEIAGDQSSATDEVFDLTGFVAAEEKGGKSAITKALTPSGLRPVHDIAPPSAQRGFVAADGEESIHTCKGARDKGGKASSRDLSVLPQPAATALKKELPSVTSTGHAVGPPSAQRGKQGKVSLKLTPRSRMGTEIKAPKEFTIGSVRKDKLMAPKEFNSGSICKDEVIISRPDTEPLAMKNMIEFESHGSSEASGGSIAVDEEVLTIGPIAMKNMSDLESDGRGEGSGSVTIGSAGVNEVVLCMRPLAKMSDASAVDEVAKMSEFQANPVTLNLVEEERLLHDLIACQADLSLSTTLEEYLNSLKGLVVSEPTPGDPNHQSVYCKDEFKEVLREVYILFRCLHARNYCLGGNFGMASFLLHESRMRLNVKFANLPNGVLQKGNPDGKEKDMKRLKSLILREVFDSQCVPHDVFLWLSMISKKEMEELLPHHCSLMSLDECGDSFLVWYDALLDLEKTNTTAFEKLCKNLKTYDAWQNKLKNKDTANDHLFRTFSSGYDDTFRDLARLLRNCRNHDGRYQHEKFALIIGEHFPNLLSDFQKELFLAGAFRRKYKFRTPK